MNLKALLPIMLLAACVDAQDGEDDPIDESFFDDESKEDAFGIKDGTPDALGVLKLANQATRSTLQSVGLTKQAIDQLLLRRDGADKLKGTADDNPFDTLRELDDVPYIGAGSFNRLLTFARNNGYVTAAPPPPPSSQDPFDAASCAGPKVTYSELIGLFAAGQDYRSLGSYTLMARNRACNAITGCGAWGPSSQARALPAYGNVTGGFPLAGGAKLHAYTGNGTDKFISIELVDQSVTSPYNKTDFRLKLNGISTADPITFPAASGYRYQVVNVLYIPPSPSDVALPGALTATLTKNCLRVVGEDPAGTTSYALLVRF